MSTRISLAELREPLPDDVQWTHETIVALVEVVEAAAEVRDHYVVAEMSDAEGLLASVDPAGARRLWGLLDEAVVELGNRLARFDLGEPA